MKKRHVRSQGLLSCCLLPAISGAAQAVSYDESAPPVVDGVLRKAVPSLKQAVSVDDALIRMGNVVADLMDQGKLSHLRFSDRTFLFWHEPELMTLTREIINEGKMQALPAPPTNSQKVQTFQQTADYVRSAHGWKGDSPVSLSVAMSQLPPALQQRIVAWKQSEDTRRDFRLERWFSDDFWKKASLTLRQIKGLHSDEPSSVYTVLHVKSLDRSNQPIDVWYSVTIEVAKNGVATP